MATCNAFAPRPSAMPARRRPPPAGPHSGRSDPRGTVSLVRRHGRRSPRWTGGSTEPGTSVSTWGLTAREDRSLRPQITPEGTCLPLTALLLRSRGPVRVPSTGEGRRAGHRDGLDAADRAAVSRHTRRRASRRDWCRLPAYGTPVGRMCPERHSPREAGASLGVSCRDRCRFGGHRVSGDHAAKAALLVKASCTRPGSACRALTAVGGGEGVFDREDDRLVQLVPGASAAAVQDVALQQRLPGLHRSVVAGRGDPPLRPLGPAAVRTAGKARTCELRSEWTTTTPVGCRLDGRRQRGDGQLSCHPALREEPTIRLLDKALIEARAQRTHVTTWHGLAPVQRPARGARS